MEHYETIILQDKYEKTLQDLVSVINRMQEDIDAYKKKHDTLSSGQKIYIEIREAAINRMTDYIHLSETVQQVMIDRLNELHANVGIAAMNAEIRHLKSENKKMATVLSKGYGYDLSLLNYQQENDFF